MSRPVVTLLAVLCVALFIVGCQTDADPERPAAGATAATETPDDDVTLVPHEEDDPELTTEDDPEPDPSPPDADAESEALEPPAPSTEADGDPDPSAELDGVETQAWDPSQSAFPPRPKELLDYSMALLPWLQGKTSPAEIVGIFDAWELGPVFEGERLTLVDTDLDGRPSLVVQFSFELAVYDPIRPGSDSYRLAYRSRDEGPVNYGVPGNRPALHSLSDFTGDGLPDIAFTDGYCGVSTCTISIHLLVSQADGYRDIARQTVGFESADPRFPSSGSISFDYPAIGVSTDHNSIDFTTDMTGDGLPDITVVGGLSGSLGAWPQREFRWVFSAAGGQLRQVLREGLPTDWAVWILIEANEAFAHENWDRALQLYDRVLHDPLLREYEWDNGQHIPGGLGRLRDAARLRTSLALYNAGDAARALEALQSLVQAGGLLADAGSHLSASLDDGAAAACLAFDEALGEAAATWDSGWNNYGRRVPRFTADDLCPF